MIFFPLYGQLGLAGVATPGIAATFAPAVKSTGAILSNSNLTLTGSTVGYDTASTTVPKSTGKWYFEFLVGAPFLSLGITTSVDRLPTLVGDSSTNGWGYFTTGAYYHGSTSGSPPSLAASDVCMIAVDIDAGKLWFGKNGTWNSGDPAAGTSPVFSGVTGTLYPAATATTNGGTSSCTFQSLLADLAHTPPSGFTAWAE